MNLFFSYDIDANPAATIRDQEHHHLSRVLRLRQGDAIFIGNGNGLVCRAVIHEIERDATRCRIIERHENFNEVPVKIVLLQGLLKNTGKMDWIIEKATELGVSECIPLLADRSIHRSDKVIRWRSIAESAVKQCVRARIPRIRTAMTLEAALPELLGYHCLLFHEAASLDAVPESLQFDTRPIAVIIGPEGGFSEKETERMRSVNADMLSLGPRRLRSETAAVAALARIVAAVERTLLCNTH